MAYTIKWTLIMVLKKKNLERPRHRRKENIKIDLKEIDVNMRNWTNLAYWRAFVDSIIHGVI